MSVPFIITEAGVSLVLENTPVHIDNSHTQFDAIVEAIKAGKFDVLPDLVSKAKAITRWAKGNVQIVDGEVTWKGLPLHNALATRILSMYEQGFDIKPMVNFLENLMQNPSKTAVDELYLFLESGQMPITPDGHFLAYKKVKDDYYDFHSGKFRNQVGDVCEMARNAVDDNRNRTCSSGLHFCSVSYLTHYYGSSGRVMIVKINPADVVSIPSDYSNAKGRTWRYKVVGEYEWNGWQKGEDYWDRSVVDDYEETEDYEDEYYDDYWEDEYEDDCDSSNNIR
jgi:hypothetical protein